MLSTKSTTRPSNAAELQPNVVPQTKENLLYDEAPDPEIREVLKMLDGRKDYSLGKSKNVTKPLWDF